MKKRLQRFLAMVLVCIMVFGGAPAEALSRFDFSEVSMPSWVSSVGSAIKSLFTLPELKASAASEGIYTYSVSNGEATITDCDENASGAITIPSTMGGYPVTSIGSYAFDNNSKLTSVVVPSGVTSIGNSVFSGCTSLSSIKIPDSVTSIGEWVLNGTSFYNNNANWVNGVLYIGKHLIAAKSEITGGYTIKSGTNTIADGALSSCYSLTSIIIPSSTTSIGIGAFSHCLRLDSITVNVGNPNYTDKNGVLFNYDKTVLIQYPAGKAENSYTIPDSVTSIGEEAFAGCMKLTNITIPNSVTSIGDYAFISCDKLSSITIPDSVTSIGYHAFYYTSLFANSENWIDEVYYIGNHLIAAKSEITGGYTIKSGTKTIADDAFSNCTSLTSIIIPDSVVSIGDSAFSNCTSLTSIIIPDSVVSIGDSAFLYCTSLTSITIPDSVVSIGDSAFSKCERLKSITIPVGVTSIGKSTFYDCKALQSVTIPVGVISIGENAFDNCWSIKNVYYSGSETKWDSINNIHSVTNYDLYWAAIHCFELINDDTEYKVSCSSNRAQGDLIIPDTIYGKPVTSINDSAYSGCIGLTNVTIPNSVTSIGDYAFISCDKLSSIIIPDSVTSIGRAAFDYTLLYYNSGNWVDGVLYIGNHLINARTGINDDYTIKPGTKTIAGGAFENCTALTSIIIPDSVVSLGNYAFYRCTGLSSVTIPNGVTSIGSSAFRDCTGLTSIIIPDRVTSIGSYAFNGCTGLTGIIIPSCVTSIGDYAIGYSSIDYKIRDFKIYCFPDSAGYDYAISNGFEYGLISEPPVLSLSAKINNADYESGTVTNKDVTITVKNTATNTGTVKYYYSTDEVSFTEFNGTLNISSDTDAKYTFKAKNQVGNFCENNPEITVKLDKTAPTGKIEIGNSKWHELWTGFIKAVSFGHFTNETVEVSVIGEDGSSAIINSGLDSVYYLKSATSLSESQLQSSAAWVKDDSFRVENDESFYVYAKITDKAGNAAFISGDSIDDGVIVDKTPPVITSKYNYNGVWTNQKVSLTGNIDAKISGLAAVSYSVDGADFEESAGDFSGYSIDETKLPDGDYNVEIRATDKASNTSSITVNVKKDTALPVISAVTDSQNGTWVHEATITVTASDALSGLQTKVYSFDGGRTWQTNNEKTYTTNQTVSAGKIMVRDVAGNIATSQTDVEIEWVDNDAPVVSEITGNPTEWTTGTVTLTVNASDELCGLADTAYSFDGGATWQAENYKVYDKNQTISSGTIQVRDKLDNTYFHRTSIVISKLDNTAPVISSVAGNPTGWTKEDVVIKVNARDTESALAAEAYSFDGGATWQSTNTKTYFENTTIASDTIQVRDVVGFVTTYNTEIVISKIDKTAPTFTEIKSTHACLDTTVSVTGAADNESGLAASAYSFDGGSSWQSSANKKYMSDATLAAGQVIVRDKAGNTFSNTEKINVVISGHSFTEWIVDKPASLYSEGKKHRDCTVCSLHQEETIEKLPTDLADSENFGIVHITIVDATNKQPIPNAHICATLEGDEYVFEADENGELTQILPVGLLLFSAYAQDYLVRNLRYSIMPGEQSIPDIGLSKKPLVDVDISSIPMTKEEIIAAGIDVDDPENSHVVKYAVELGFDAGYEIYAFPFIYYWNYDTNTEVMPGGGDTGPGTGTGTVGPLFYHSTGYFNGIGHPGTLPDGTNFTVFVTEKFFLIIYGEVKWLKEMFDVEMLVINNSLTDTIEACVGEIILPDGLSLAAMVSGYQNARHLFGHIDEGGTASHHWYVRGDKAGTYDVSATLEGTMMPFNERFNNTYVAPNPIKVYAGDAMMMNIIIPDAAYSYNLFEHFDLDDYDDVYPITIELENVSDKPIYGLSHKIEGLVEKVVRTEHIWKENEYHEKVTEGIFKSEWYDDDYVFSVEELKPGEKLVVKIETTIEFVSKLDTFKRSQTKLNGALEVLGDIAKIARIADPTGITQALGIVSSILSEVDIRYYLSHAVVHTLEGSTTTIPYKFTIEHIPHPSIYLKLTDMFLGKLGDVVLENVFNALGIAGGKLLKDVYTFVKEDERTSFATTSKYPGTKITAWVETDDNKQMLKDIMSTYWGSGRNNEISDYIKHLATMQITDSESWDSTAVLIEKMLQNNSMTKEQHYARNSFNIGLPNTQGEAISLNWKRCNENDSKCRQFSADPDSPNIVFVSPDGTREAVYSETTGELVTDARDVGTFNFRPYERDPEGHLLYDIIPWVLWGNSSDDTTTPMQRIGASMSLFGQQSAAPAKNRIKANSVSTGSDDLAVLFEKVDEYSTYNSVESNYETQMYLLYCVLESIEYRENEILDKDTRLTEMELDELYALASQKLQLYKKISELWIAYNEQNPDAQAQSEYANEFYIDMKNDYDKYLLCIDALKGGTDSDNLFVDVFTLSSSNENAEYVDGKLSFYDKGDIEVIANSAYGSGVLCVDLGDGEIVRIPIAATGEHECIGEWTTFYEPSEDYNGFRAKYCKTCKTLMDIDFPEQGNPIVSEVRTHNYTGKMMYAVGESFDISKMTLDVIYSDGTTTVINDGFIFTPTEFEKPGKQAVKISYGNEDYSYEVSVVEPLSKITMSSDAEMMLLRERIKLNVLQYPIYCGSSELIWSSSDPNVAAISQDGVVTAVGVGTATITVKTADERLEASCLITVNPNEFTVTWAVDGEQTQTKVSEGAVITEPAAPVKDGYIFKGWSPNIPDKMPAEDVTFTAVFEEVVLTKIEINTMPTKTKYRYKESGGIDLGGLTLKATYSNGSTSIISDTKEMNATGFDTSSKGSKAITVEYGGQKTSFNIEVKMLWWQWIIKIILFGWLWY